ncbi:MAG: M48 family metalloprotease [Bryobacteraceae bacterium]
MAFFSAALAFGADKQPKLRELKPGFNLFSKEQDVQMGQEYATQVEQQMHIITNPEIQGFVERIGKKLASSPNAQGFPFTFKVVQEDSINAFALPGGPTFTHTGLIKAADNEGQIAGVLAHEISHVILRHGTNQASKANLLQLPAMIGAQMAGGGIIGSLAQLGIGLGANSVLLKFSRNAERDADLMGTRIMSSVGYNPIEMARFFEKLEAESGKQNWISNFMSDHPNPGNRVKAVSDEIKLLPARNYDADSGSDALARVRAAISGLPPAPKKAQPAQTQAQGNPQNIQAARPSQNLKNFESQEVMFSYPDNWQAFPNNQTGEVTMAAAGGIFQNGAVAYGTIAGIRQVKSRDLAANTQALVQGFQQQDQNLKVNGQARQANINGSSAMAVRLQGQSAFQNTNEAIVVITVDHPKGMFYMLLVAPENDLQYAQPIFDRMINSIRVPR